MVLQRLILGAGLALGWLGLSAQEYAVPTVPDSIVSPSARADYATLHFWDQYDFRDTTLLRLGAMAEQATVDFLSLLPYATSEGQQQAVDRWLSGAACLPQAYEFFAAMADKYLADESSPLRNEQLHLLVSRHAPSYVAPDFRFQTADGQAGRLHATATDRLTLLLFYDPDCERCRDLIFRLKHSSALNAAISDNRLQVVAVYTECDEALWNQTKGDMPANWLTVIDCNGLQGHTLYDLQALPVTYLLDRDKRILLRHPSLFMLQSGFQHD